MPTPASFRAAPRRLAAADSLLAPVIARVGPCSLRPDASGTHFAHVARAIVYQQLSNRAAGTIHGRMLALFGDRPPTAPELLAAPDESLRSAGLSRQKILYLKDLATKTASGELPVERLHTLPDDEVVTALTRVKGVGCWTAQMFLIFRLGRPDVLADTDLGIRKAVQGVYGLHKLPTPKQVAAIATPWRPYRTAACWYLWRSLDNGFWA